MAHIKADKYSIDEAFRSCFYVVPDYQREYVWTEKEVKQLLDDISEQIDATSDTEYFVGTVLVSPGSQKNYYEVIDGQQRLTTFFLVLCALRNRFKGFEQHETISGLISTKYTARVGTTKTTLKLEPRYENTAELMARLVATDADSEKARTAIQQAGIKSFGSLENLLTAYDTIHRYLLDNYENEAALLGLWGYLANNVVFIQISTDVSSALKIFETINERGIGLNPMDLLKNLLFTQVGPGEFTKLKDEWKRITGPLERAEEKPLRFLRYFLMANYKIRNKRGDAVVREDEIYEWFVDRENAALVGYRQKPFEFVRKIIRNVEHYLSFAADRGSDGQTSVPMENLRALTGDAFSLHYVLLLAAADLPRHLFDHFVRQLENFLFYFIFTKTPTKYLERNFSSWADELREITETRDATDRVRSLDRFITDHFQSSMASKSGELTDVLRRYTLHSMQKYRTRYLLAKLTQHVDMAFKGLSSAGRLGEYKGLEIEHILPNTPSTELLATFAAQNPGANYHEYKNRLGNFTLLEKPINIVAGNNFFDAKKAEYRKCRHYLTSSIAELSIVGMNSSINRINEKLKSFDTWTAATIDQRQAMLIELVKDVWKTSLVESS
jgi:hypothetical protein